MAAQTQAQAKSKINGAAAHAAHAHINVPPVETASAPDAARAAAMSAVQDTMAAMGITMPSWKQVAFGLVVTIGCAVGGIIAAPVLASILAAGTLTVTANGFALWLASALGYLIALWGSVKAASGIRAAAGWLSRFVAAAPTAA